jgi:hypothetical protein
MVRADVEKGDLEREELVCGWGLEVVGKRRV